MDLPTQNIDPIPRLCRYEIRSADAYNVKILEYFKFRSANMPTLCQYFSRVNLYASALRIRIHTILESPLMHWCERTLRLNITKLLSL